MKIHLITPFLAAVCLTACRSKTRYDGTYVSHIKGEYAIADDTLLIEDSMVIERTGFRKIRNGRLEARGHKVRRWTLNGADAPPMQFAADKLILGSTIYQKQP